MAVINGVRFCRIEGEWVNREDVIAKASERILGLLTDGPKTRRYFGKVIGGEARVIDWAIARLARANRIACSVGPVINCRRGKTWVSLD
jgi:hypothetical protein